MEGFTHLVELYGFRCYFNEDTGDIMGTNWINELMIDFFIYMDQTFGENEYFEIKIIKKL